MSVTLSWLAQSHPTCFWVVYLVSMPKPGGALLLIRDQGDPLVAGSTQSLPDIRVSAHAASLFRRVERQAGSGTDAVRKALVVPECGVLEHKPPSWLAEAAVSLPLVTMTANKTWSV